MSCQKIQQDKTRGEESQVGHNSDQIKDIVSFTVVLWMKIIIFLLLICGYPFQITHFGSVYKKKLPKNFTAGSGLAILIFVSSRFILDYEDYKGYEGYEGIYM